MPNKSAIGSTSPERRSGLASPRGGTLLHPARTLLPPKILDEIDRLKKFDAPQEKKRRGIGLFFMSLLIATLLGLLLNWLFDNRTLMDVFLPKMSGGSAAELLKSLPRSLRLKQLSSQPEMPVEMSRSPRFKTKNINFAKYLPPLTLEQVDHLNRVLKYIYSNINSNTHMAYSLPGDRRLRHWSVIYDDAMRTILHIKTGDIETAKKTIDYFMANKAIQKTGWITKDGRRMIREGWIVNIVDGAEGRPGGRGIEHIAHAGPNAYLGIASIHLYRATGERKYLRFARERWMLIKDLQNEKKGDPNYGGIRMGPMGNPENPQEQRLDFKAGNPSWYQFYNGEHAADFKALSDLLAQVDETHAEEYAKASALISVWDKKIYDKKRHLFYIGTTEVPFYEPNIGQWLKAGVMPIHPLDTTALKISVYGVEGLDRFEPHGALKIRQAVDDHFKVNLVRTLDDGTEVKFSGYDFISAEDRAKLVLFEEEGPDGDVKVKKGMGREPLLTDEWSTWMALADLRLAEDYLLLGNERRAKVYLGYYKENALSDGFKGAYKMDNDSLAYPYAHAMPYSLNKPVGFGWNTHHEPYALIGGISRTLGALRFDPFHMNGGKFSIKSPLSFEPSLDQVASKEDSGLITEAEIYLQEAWDYVRVARAGGPDTENQWKLAAASVERMLREHPDWCEVARTQNDVARRSKDKYPLYGQDRVKVKDLGPLYKKYWALYHIGAGEFIRFMAYSEVAKLARARFDDVARVAAREKAEEAATNIIRKYSFSQAYDTRGWMWQPVNSLYEYLGFYQFSPEEYLKKLHQSPDQSSRLPLDPVLNTIKNTY